MSISGLKGLLRGNSYDANFILLAAQVGPAAHALDYIREFLKHHDDGSTYLIHIAAFANDFSALKWKPNSNVIIYDFLSNEYPGMVEFYKTFCAKQNPIFKNVLIFDDLKMFMEYNAANFGRVRAFFQKLPKMCIQVMGIARTDSLTYKDLEFLYNCSDSVAALTAEGMMGSKFLCQFIRTKPSGKVSLEESTYSVENGEVKETQKKIVTEIDQSQNQKNILSSLTTFKLTVEEEEQESRSRLHLPYFNAQSNEVQEPEEDGYSDEEDEEI